MRMFTVALYLAAVIIGLIIVGSLDRPWSSYGMSIPDAVAEKYLTLSAWNGYGADASMQDLVRHYGLAADSYDTAVTRTPGALLIQAPLIFVPDGAVRFLLGAASVLSIVAICHMTAGIAAIPDWAMGLVALVVVGASPMREGYVFGTTAVITAALITATWRHLDRPTLAGTLLALAVVLKVWPALLLFALWLHRRQSARVTLVVGAGLSALGLLLPGVELASVFESAQSWTFFVDFASNWSLAKFLGPSIALTLGAVVLTLGYVAYADESRRIAWTILVGLAVSPLSWAWYWAAAIPAVATIWRSFTPSGRDPART